MDERKQLDIPRLLIGGTGSGCGKTTLTCAILKALLKQGLKVTSFKCGPDYIDPMFHSEIIGTRSRNLDAFLCGKEAVPTLLARGAAGSDIAIVEGVMGFYDGMGGKTPDNSSAQLALYTHTPAVLVVNAAGMGLSVAAVVKGYQTFGENTIRGVLINGCSDKMFPSYRSAIEEHTGLPVLGCMPKMPDAALESRHLGLVTAAEVHALQDKIDKLAAQAEQTIDLTALVHIARSAPPIYYTLPDIPKGETVRIAIARDKAFCFYYEDSLQLLEEMGAELVPFSPLSDTHLPSHIGGLILGGGYPELYARQLSANRSLLEDIGRAVKAGLPTWAECGGFMTLGNSLHDMDGAAYPMAGVLETESSMTGRLQNFGYIRLTANRDNLFCRAGESINAHEFHYAQSTDEGDGWTAEKVSAGRKRTCCMASPTLFAGYPHLHLWGNWQFAVNFLDKSRQKQRADAE